MMIRHYFSFLIDEIWLDWWNDILLFIFSTLTKLNLICRIRAFSIRDRPLGSSRSGLHFELASGGPGTHHFFGLDEWADKPVFLTISEENNTFKIIMENKNNVPKNKDIISKQSK